MELLFQAWPTRKETDDSIIAYYLLLLGRWVVNVSHSKQASKTLSLNLRRHIRYQGLLVGYHFLHRSQIFQWATPKGKLNPKMKKNYQPLDRGVTF